MKPPLFRAVLVTVVAAAACTLTAGVANAQPFAYVLGKRAGDSASSVTVIDTATNGKVATIPLGGVCNCFNPHGVAVSPDGSRVYVSSTTSNTVSVLDTRSNTLIATWNVGTRPTGVVVSPDGSRLYVINSASLPTLTSVRVIQTATGAAIGNIPIGVSNALGIAVTPDGSRLYVTTSTGLAGNDVVKAISTAANAVIATIPVGQLSPADPTGSFPIGIDVAPDGTTVYVAVRHSMIVSGISSGAVAVISTATNTVISHIRVGINPHAVRVAPDGASVYVAHNGSPFSTSVIARPAHVVVASISGTPHSNSMAVTPDGSRVYVVSQDGSVIALDSATRRAFAQIPFTAALEGAPEAIAIAPVPVQPPTALLLDSISGNSVTLRWTPPISGPAPTHYVVEGGVFPGHVLGSLPTAGPTPNLTFTAPNGTYFVRVHSMLGTGRSDASNEIRIVVIGEGPCMAPPNPPTDLRLDKSSNVVTVSWAAPLSGPRATGYIVNVAGAFTGAFTTTGLALSGTAGPGTYIVSVAATNACGASEPTPAQSISIP